MLAQLKCICLVYVMVILAMPAGADDYPSYMYRVEIMTPGGPLPFIMKTDQVYNKAINSRSHSKAVMIVFNGPERIQCEMPAREWVVYGERRDLLGRIVRRIRYTQSVAFPEYDSVLEWTGWTGAEVENDSRKVMYGTWRTRRGEDFVELPAVVTKLDWTLPITDSQRFRPFPDDTGIDMDEPANYAGRWKVKFESSDEPAVAIFEVDDDQLAAGTFMTTTGDYRYLSGRVDGPYLRLSTFDGAHAFLFYAEKVSRNHIKGDFWSGDWHHETWTAVRDDDAQLPDAFEQTTVTDEHALDELVFKELDGKPTKVLDALDATGAKARVIEIFGSWCPNCADASRELVSLKKKYGDELGVVGLAFEVSDDFERSVTQVRRHHEHLGTDWELLIAGLADKDKATKTLGFLDQVRAFPTLVFLDEHNRVRAVYSGFSGPATGEAYTDQRARFEALIEKMIEE